MKTEFAALILLLLAIFGGPAGVAIYENYDGANRPTEEMTLVGHTPLNGNWSQRELRVKEGQRVRLRLTSEDVTHGFLIPEFGVNAGPISPGKFKIVEFIADRQGEFKFYCNIVCSHQHGGMTGMIIVE